MEKSESCLMVILGASGDLTKKKLIPALFALFTQNLLPEAFGVLGAGRTGMSDEEFRDKMKKAVSDQKEGDNKATEILDAFLQKLYYVSIDTKTESGYKKLKENILRLDDKLKVEGNYLFYLATPPSMYETIVKNLGSCHLNQQSPGYRRIVIEKPFGYDLASAKILNEGVHKYFTEDQIFRIDHYLGKETVQNLLVTRFSNGIFEPLWNRNYIHHIEITAAESEGIEARGGYYDSAGALRDMVQNHLLQLVGLTAMEPPAVFDSNSIRNETLKVFQALRPIEESEVAKYVIRGQYTTAHIRGLRAAGYRDEKDVAENSRTETYVALKFYIDNWRWGGVPFYIRTGKRLPTRVSEIVINFNPTPHYLFAHDSICSSCNQLVIRLHPDEGILLKFGMKVPGAGFNVQSVNMDFHYSELSDVHVPAAYERLLMDVLAGDSTLYARGDAVEEAWKFVNPIQNAWLNNPHSKIYGYPAGTWGPETADELIEETEMTWRYPCKNLSNDGIYCEL